MLALLPRPAGQFERLPHGRSIQIPLPVHLPVERAPTLLDCQEYLLVHILRQFRIAQHPLRRIQDAPAVLLHQTLKSFVTQYSIGPL